MPTSSTPRLAILRVEAACRQPLSLNPQDAVAYNDRGLAKLQLGRDDEAISDFSAAIKIKKRESRSSGSYENRADGN